jgi:hypothetical protein
VVVADLTATDKSGVSSDVGDLSRYRSGELKLVEGVKIDRLGIATEPYAGAASDVEARPLGRRAILSSGGAYVGETNHTPHCKTDSAAVIHCVPLKKTGRT